MTMRSVIATGSLMMVACSGSGLDGPNTASGGSAGSGGVTATLGGSSGSGGSGGAAGSAGSAGGSAGPPCPGPTPTALPATGRLELPVQVTVNGTNAVVGEPAAGREGRSFQLSLFKFFLSEPVLVGADDSQKPAQFLGADGLPEPYELHLVDADDPATQVLRLAAEPGSYVALRFGVGVPDACNLMSSTGQVYPLNPDSDMFWTWGSQFMFVRIEGTSQPSETGAWAPFVYHVGFPAAFARLTVPGALEVGAQGTGPTLTLDVDLLLKADADGLPSPQHSVPDGWVIDNLEQNQPFAFR